MEHLELSPATPVTATLEIKPTYRTRAEANRANAVHSTGPKSEEGKRIASHNAVKTALTGRTVNLPTDNLDEFNIHMAAIAARFQPVTAEEQQLAEQIGHTEWRLQRIPVLLLNFEALGRIRCADLHQDQPLDVRRGLIEAEGYALYEKQLRNLALQQSRLTRELERQVARLTAVQEPRLRKQRELQEEAHRLLDSCERRQIPFPLGNLQALGFEISMDQLREYKALQLCRQRNVKWDRIGIASTLDEIQLNIDYQVS